MALQRINWTQIDTENVPTGSTINLGSLPIPLTTVFTEDLYIAGINFFDYLFSGFTGTTPFNIEVADNAGLEISGHTLSTIYNTTLDPSLATPVSVGGIPAGTTVTQLTGLTFVDFVDELLFPIVLPTYMIPTISFSGIATQTIEIGNTLSGNLNTIGTKNDAGAFTQLRLIKNGSPLVTSGSPSILSQPDVPPQFGFVDPNNPNHRYTIPSPFSEVYVIPYTSYPVITTYGADGNYSGGLSKQNNKGGSDVRPALIRSVNAAQLGDINFGSSAFATVTGKFPFFWGVTPTLPTPSSIASIIASGGATKDMVQDANGSLSIPYNTNGNFIWFAYFQNYPTKTKWFVNALDNGDIDNTFISTAVLDGVNSPNGFWTGIPFKMHWSVYATIQATIQFNN